MLLLNPVTVLVLFLFPSSLVSPFHARLIPRPGHQGQFIFFPFYSPSFRRRASLSPIACSPMEQYTSAHSSSSYFGSRYEQGIDSKIVIMGNSGVSIATPPDRHLFNSPCSFCHQASARRVSCNATPRISSIQRTRPPRAALSLSRKRSMSKALRSASSCGTQRAKNDFEAWSVSPFSSLSLSLSRNVTDVSRALKAPMYYRGQAVVSVYFSRKRSDHLPVVRRKRGPTLIRHHKRFYFP